mmetsp:Transcript_33658/g.60923  ORF Transcript_33658/g.60923 Transcript_33658/m.60923 type:complete len:769 (-) Transcript_33658:154-2460(-)
MLEDSGRVSSINSIGRVSAYRADDSKEDVATPTATKPVPEREHWVVPANYALPRKVVARCLEQLDAEEQPDKPGMLSHSTIENMVTRFDCVFNARQNRQKEVEAVFHHLISHTRRRRGESALQAGLLEWEQTSRVFDLFAVQLNICERILFTMDFTVRSTILSRVSSTIMITTIFLSIVTWMVSTLPQMRYVPEGCVSVTVGECQPKAMPYFETIEGICVYLFTIEYLLRLFTVHSVRFELLDEFFVSAVLKGTTNTESEDSGLMAALGCPARPKNRLDGGLRTVVKHIFGITNLVDLFAVLPYWIEQFRPREGAQSSQGGALVALRLLRLTRIFRVFKLGRYSDAFLLFTRVMEQSAPALALMTFFIIMGCGLFGTLIWFAEGGEWFPEGHEQLVLLQPPIVGRGAYLRRTAVPWTSPAVPGEDAHLEETPFESIIHSFWFVVVTITTVGYGDICPTTVVGKLIGTLMILAGVIVLAMPIGVVGANFSREYYRVVDDKKRRHLLQKQLDTLAAVEAEQDAFLKDEGVLQTMDEQPRAIEIHKKLQTKKQLIETAEAIDVKWAEEFKSQQYGILSAELRRWLASLFPETASVKTGDTPIVSLKTMAELDVLTTRVHDVIREHTSAKELADFTLTEAKMFRWHWALFVDQCWDCVISICRVDELPEPPEFFEMKGAVARVSQTGYTNVEHVQVTSPTTRHRMTAEDMQAQETDFLQPYVASKSNLRVPSASSASTAVPVNQVPGGADGAAGAPASRSQQVVLLPNMPDA